MLDPSAPSVIRRGQLGSVHWLTKKRPQALFNPSGIEKSKRNDTLGIVEPEVDHAPSSPNYLA
jgi:hypothetical protein